MDMLVKLYDLRPDAELEARIAAHGFEIRPALPPELHVVTRWIASRFGEGWASEATIAMSRQPVSCLLAIAEGKLAGFACYDATARGFFGPTVSMKAIGARAWGRRCCCGHCWPCGTLAMVMP